MDSINNNVPEYIYVKEDGTTPIYFSYVNEKGESSVTPVTKVTQKPIIPLTGSVTKVLIRKHFNGETFISPVEADPNDPQRYYPMQEPLLPMFEEAPGVYAAFICLDTNVAEVEGILSLSVESYVPLLVGDYISWSGTQWSNYKSVSKDFKTFTVKNDDLEGCVDVKLFKYEEFQPATYGIDSELIPTNTKLIVAIALTNKKFCLNNVTVVIDWAHSEDYFEGSGSMVLYPSKYYGDKATIYMTDAHLLKNGAVVKSVNNDTTGLALMTEDARRRTRKIIIKESDAYRKNLFGQSTDDELVVFFRYNSMFSFDFAYGLPRIHLFIAKNYSELNPVQSVNIPDAMMLYLDPIVTYNNETGLYERNRYAKDYTNAENLFDDVEVYAKFQDGWKTVFSSKGVYDHQLPALTFSKDANFAIKIKSSATDPIELFGITDYYQDFDVYNEYAATVSIEKTGYVPTYINKPTLIFNGTCNGKLSQDTVHLHPIYIDDRSCHIYEWDIIHVGWFTLIPVVKPYGMVIRIIDPNDVEIARGGSYNARFNAEIVGKYKIVVECQKYYGGVYTLTLA